MQDEAVWEDIAQKSGQGRLSRAGSSREADHYGLPSSWCHTSGVNINSSTKEAPVTAGMSLLS